MSQVPQRIRYENTPDDLVAFHEFFFYQSPHMQRTIRRGTWVLPAVVVVAAAILDLARGGLEWSVWAVVFAVLYVFIYRGMVRRNVRRTIDALLKEGSNDTVLCEHELEITPDFLVERTALSETKSAWSSIARVESTDDHTFVFTQAQAAHIVPRGRVLEGDYEAFCDAVRDRAAAARD